MFLVLGPPWLWPLPGSGISLVLAPPWLWSLPGIGTSLPLVSPRFWQLLGSGISLLCLPPSDWLYPCKKDSAFTHKHSMKTIVSVDTGNQVAPVGPLLL